MLRTLVYNIQQTKSVSTNAPCRNNQEIRARIRTSPQGPSTCPAPRDLPQGNLGTCKSDLQGRSRLGVHRLGWLPGGKEAFLTPIVVPSHMPLSFSPLPSPPPRVSPTAGRQSTHVRPLAMGSGKAKSGKDFSMPTACAPSSRKAYLREGSPEREPGCLRTPAGPIRCF